MIRIDGVGKVVNRGAKCLGRSAFAALASKSATAALTRTAASAVAPIAMLAEPVYALEAGALHDTVIPGGVLDQPVTSVPA
ncbi:MAG: hypothetical protein QOI59_3452 [Gammaproteobacteria bacterium]|nr:hypothetical protein [Gammaproteobacteria bacterium]